jgi:competence protein ComEA
VPVTITTPTPRATPTIATLIVDVRGAVNKPGVYSLTTGSRVQDALALAGDVLANADTRTLNLARKLIDGEQIYVPQIGEAPPAPASTASSSRASGARTPTASAPIGKINVNTATLDELDKLPGIGPSIAQRIIDYRTQNGEFKKIDDLKKVRGIGDALFDQIKDLVTLQ